MSQTQNIYYAHNLIKCTGERMISKTEPPQTAEQVGYVLNATREKIDFSYHPHLIQRIEITEDGSVSFQYMGSSEFEDGCVGRAQHKMIEWLSKMELMLVEQDSVEVLCHPLMIDEAMMQAQDLLAEKPSLRPLEPLMPERYSNFLCVDNAYFFSKKG